MSRQKLLACSEQTHVPIFNPKWKTVATQFRDSILYRHNQQTPRKTQRVGGNGGELTVYPITTAELKAVDCCFALLQLKETPLSFCFPSNGHNTRPQLNVMDDLLLVYGDDDSLPPVHPFLSRSPFFFLLLLLPNRLFIYLSLLYMYVHLCFDFFPILIFAYSRKNWHFGILCIQMRNDLTCNDQKKLFASLSS